MSIKLTNNQLEPQRFYISIGKRIMDLLITIPSLIILMPILFIIGILIRTDSSGEIFYRQTRMGRFCKEFSIYKFRTMIAEADKVGPLSTEQGDTRITKVGKILRKYSLDELPQLLNVLKGDMSIVGYRPGLKKNYSSNDLNSELFKLKPGITGYAQIYGRSRLTSDERRAWEHKYAENISLAEDIKIIIKTVRIVVSAEGTN